jgi:hypothetical protein
MRTTKHVACQLQIARYRRVGGGLRVEIPPHASGAGRKRVLDARCWQRVVGAPSPGTIRRDERIDIAGLIREGTARVCQRKCLDGPAAQRC